MISSPVIVLLEYAGLEVSEGHMPCVLKAHSLLVYQYLFQETYPALGSKGTEKPGRLGTD